MGQTLANHSYVDLGLVGYDGCDSVQCHTDLTTCCREAEGNHRGDLYFPDGDRLSFDDDIYEIRNYRRVDLRRRLYALSPTGIYRCDISTNAVHDDRDVLVRDVPVYIGLYTDIEGILTIS